MVSMSRPYQLVLVLALSLGTHSLAQGAFTFTSEVTPGSMSSASGLSTLTYYSTSGASNPNGSTSMPIALSLITLDSSATSAETLGGFFSDTLTITDGGQTGTLTFSGTLTASGITSSGGSSFQLTSDSAPQASVLINGHEYSMSNINFAAPGANYSVGTFTGMLSYSSSALSTVPEPSSMILMGLGGLVLVAARRFRKSA